MLKLVKNNWSRNKIKTFSRKTASSTKRYRYNYLCPLCLFTSKNIINFNKRMVLLSCQDSICQYSLTCDRCVDSCSLWCGIQIIIIVIIRIRRWLWLWYRTQHFLGNGRVNDFKCSLYTFWHTPESQSSNKELLGG